MPRWRLHPEYYLDEGLARKVFKALDNPGRSHLRYRRMTHDPLKAAMMGFLIGLQEGKPIKGAVIGFMHVVTDKSLNRLLHPRRCRR